MLTKPLSPMEIAKVRRHAETYLADKITLRAPNAKGFPYGRYFTFKKSAPHNKGSTQIVIPIPAIEIQGKMRRFVVKIPLWLGHQDNHLTSKTEHLLRTDTEIWPHHRVIGQEVMSHLLNSNGIDTPIHHAVTILHPALLGIVCEDLSADGKLREAHGFDFKKIKNSAELQGELERKVEILRKLQKENVISQDHHISKDNPKKAFQKIFVVQIDANGKGTLIPADLDNSFVQMKSTARVDHITALRFQHELHREFKEALEGSTKSTRFKINY